MLKLHLGCGEVIKENFVNVDIRDLPGVDLVADVTLPLPGINPGTASRIEAYDVLEHFPQNQILSVLKLWVSYLGHKGIIVIRVPDLELTAKKMLANELPIHTAQWLIYGGQTHEFDYHKAGFSGGLLEGLLIGAGCNKILQKFNEDHNIVLVAEK